MSNTAVVKAKGLASRLRARKKLIQDIVQFALKLDREIGVQIRREVGSFNTNIVRSIENFNGFSFLIDTGMSSMGGNELVICEGRFEVFRVYWQDGSFTINNCQVKYFDADKDWVRDLRATIRNKASILAQIRRKEKSTESKMLTEAEKQRRTKELTEECGRFGL